MAPLPEPASGAPAGAAPGSPGPGGPTASELASGEPSPGSGEEDGGGDGRPGRLDGRSRGGRPGTGRTPRPAPEEEGEEGEEGEDGEPRARRAFCTRAVRLLRRRAASGAGTGGPGSRRAAEGSRRPAPVPVPVPVPVPEALLSRLHLKHTAAALARLAAPASRPHDPSRCPACVSQRAALARDAFLRRSRTRLETPLLRERLDARLHATDLLTRLRDAHRALPRPSDHPALIWSRLTGRVLPARPDPTRPDPRARGRPSSPSSLLTRGCC